MVTQADEIGEALQRISDAIRAEADKLTDTHPVMAQTLRSVADRLVAERH